MNIVKYLCRIHIGNMGIQLFFFFLICMPWNKVGKVSKLISSEGEIIQIKDFLTKISLLPLLSNGNNAEKWNGCHHT